MAKKVQNKTFVKSPPNSNEIRFTRAQEPENDTVTFMHRPDLKNEMKAKLANLMSQLESGKMTDSQLAELAASLSLEDKTPASGQPNRAEPRALGSKATLTNLLREAVEASPGDFSWSVLVCQDVTEVLALIASHLSPEQSDTALSKLILARSIWTCMACQTYEVDLVLAGYLECTFCTHWYHCKCVEKMCQTVVTPFVCHSCLSLQSEPVEKETVIVLPDDGTLEMSVAIESK